MKGGGECSGSVTTSGCARQCFSKFGSALQFRGLTGAEVDLVAGRQRHTWLNNTIWHDNASLPPQTPRGHSPSQSALAAWTCITPVHCAVVISLPAVSMSASGDAAGDGTRAFTSWGAAGEIFFVAPSNQLCIAARPRPSASGMKWA